MNSFGGDESTTANTFSGEPNASDDCIYSPYQFDAVCNLIGSGAWHTISEQGVLILKTLSYDYFPMVLINK